MSVTISSICVNSVRNCWLTSFTSISLFNLNNFSIYYISDIGNPNCVWKLLPPPPAKFIQIKCDVRSSSYLLAVDLTNQVWYANLDVTTNPNWMKSPSSLTYYIESVTGGSAFASGIGGGNVLWYTGRLDQPNWTTQPTPVPVAKISANCIGSNGYTAILGTDNYIYWAYVWGVSKPTWYSLYFNAPPGAYNTPGMVSDFIMAPSGRILAIPTGGGNSILISDRDVTSSSWSFDYIKTPGDIKFKYITSWDLSNIVAVGVDNTIWYSSTCNKDSTFVKMQNAFSLNNNKYYGNSTPVKLPPILITLTGTIPVLNWRNGIEFHSNGCGGSSGCGTFSRENYSYSNNGLAIEAVPDIQNYNQHCTSCTYKIGLVPIPSGNSCRCCVTGDALTHVFGQGSGYSIPANNDQYAGGKPLNALNLQIIPINKVYNTSDNTLATFNDDTSIKPTFKSIQFQIPNPAEPKLDASIPKILLYYYNLKLLDIYQLNDYMKKYAFTNITDTDGKIKPRYAQTTNDNSGIVPSSVIDNWKSLIDTTASTLVEFNKSATAYCAGDNLKTDWCSKTYCKSNDCDDNLLAFCKLGGNATLPPFETNGVLPMTPVTQAQLYAAYPRYTDFPAICGCNMPPNYYNQLTIKGYQERYEKHEDADKAYGNVHNVGIGAGMAKCNPDTTCRTQSGTTVPHYGDNLQNCQNINYLDCSQIQNLKVGSIVDGASVTAAQINNCSINTTNINSDGTKTTTTSGASASTGDGTGNDAAAKAYVDEDIAAALKTAAKSDVDAKAAPPGLSTNKKVAAVVAVMSVLSILIYLLFLLL